jgi:hypothetical protein
LVPIDDKADFGWQPAAFIGIAVSKMNESLAAPPWLKTMTVVTKRGGTAFGSQELTLGGRCIGPVVA